MQRATLAVSVSEDEPTAHSAASAGRLGGHGSGPAEVGGQIRGHGDALVHAEGAQNAWVPRGQAQQAVELGEGAARALTPLGGGHGHGQVRERGGRRHGRVVVRHDRELGGWRAFLQPGIHADALGLSATGASADD